MDLSVSQSNIILPPNCHISEVEIELIFAQDSLRHLLIEFILSTQNLVI